MPLPRSTPSIAGVDASGVLAFLDAADRAGVDLHSVMMARRGQVFAEGWWEPYAADRVHLGYSLSKSFTATAIGLLVDEGRLRLDDPVLGFWTLPWQLVRGVAQAIAAGGRRLPLTTVAWRLRGVVIGIAAIQSAQAHQVGLALVIAGIGVISYAMPVWERNFQRALLAAGDRAVREAGLAAAMATFVRRCPSTAGSRARVRALEPSTAPTRPVGLVR